MFDNEIISPNEKIKKIRKQILRVTQERISHGICTKNNLSQIENNKQKLTFNLAIGIANNFNKIAKEKNIDIESITAEYLIKDEDNQANEILENNILKDLNKIEIIEQYEKKLSEAEKLIAKYNISDCFKIKLYRIAADFYFKKRYYYKSDEMCNEGLKVCINSKNMVEEANLYVSKARNNVNRGNYLESLEQLSVGEKISNCVGDSELFKRICFNKALTYKKIKKYDEAIRYLRILTDTFELEEKKLLDVKMLSANCLIEQNKFDEAENLYIEILEPAMKLDDKDLLAMAYKNLAELYLNKKDYKYAEIYIKESLINSPSNRHYDECLYFATKILKKLNKDSEPYLIKALGICEQNDRENLDLIEKVIYELVLIYMNKENDEKLNLMVKKSEELNINYNLIFPSLVEYYRHRNEEKSIEINQKLINKSKQIKNI